MNGNQSSRNIDRPTKKIYVDTDIPSGREPENDHIDLELIHNENKDDFGQDAELKVDNFDESAEVRMDDIDEDQDTDSEEKIKNCVYASKVFAPGDVLVIPDIHGDITSLREALRLGNVMDESQDKWIGGNTFVVQTGDIFDRGPDTVEILDLFEKLQTEAIENGGCIVQLMGNHEFLNIAGDFRYASAKETRKFGGITERKAALDLDSAIGDYLRNLRIAVVLEQGDTRSLFVHAGLLPKMIEDMGGTISSVNQYFREKLQSCEQREIKKIAKSSYPMLENGPLWSRYFAGVESEYLCKTLDKTLELASADRMIIGHTVQSGGVPTFKCDNKLVMVDTGLSKYYGGNVALLILQRESQMNSNNQRSQSQVGENGMVSPQILKPQK